MFRTNFERFGDVRASRAPGRAPERSAILTFRSRRRRYKERVVHSCRLLAGLSRSSSPCRHRDGVLRRLRRHARRAVVHGQAGPARVDNAALGAIAWRGGPTASSSGEVVRVFVSDARLPRRPRSGPSSSRDSRTGRRLAALTSNIATLAEVQRLCGAQALGATRATSWCRSESRQATARRPKRSCGTSTATTSRSTASTSLECNRPGPETLGERRHRVPGSRPARRSPATKDPTTRAIPARPGPRSTG